MTDELHDHTRKVLCDECGEAVKVEAGKDFADVHKHTKKTEKDKDSSSFTGNSSESGITIKSGAKK